MSPLLATCGGANLRDGGGAVTAHEACTEQHRHAGAADRLPGASAVEGTASAPWSARAGSPDELLDALKSVKGAAIGSADLMCSLSQAEF
jgi:hypothetical protein